MTILAMLGGIGAAEILILLILILFFIISPVMWFQERSKRKYWQTKAEDYEKRLLDKK